eukprot:768512-Hanusia_phi.AAC.2
MQLYPSTCHRGLASPPGPGLAKAPPVSEANDGEEASDDEAKNVEEVSDYRDQPRLQANDPQVFGANLLGSSFQSREEAP